MSPLLPTRRLGRGQSASLDEWLRHRGVATGSDLSRRHRTCMSTTGRRPLRPAYAAAKAALTGLMRQLAVEYGADVRVNAVLPGPILTRAWDGIGEADRQASAERTAMGRLGRQEEVAGAVAFLLSEDASFVTGASLVVDGGWSVRKTSS